MTPENAIRSIGLCGAGQMGAAAAACFKRAGYRVLVWDQNPEKLAQTGAAVDAIETWLNQYIPSPMVRGTVDAADMRTIDHETDLVMECITEDMARKVDLLRQFTEAIRRQAIFITTTSGLSITEMGRSSGTEQLLAGAHFWNPPHLMPLVEVVAGQRTPADVLDRVCALVRSIGKNPVRVNRDVPGFIGNRLLHAMWREAIHLVQQGIASAEDIDLVARMTFGLRMAVVGPLENMDLVGLDLVQSIHAYLLRDLADEHQPLEALNRSVAEGHLGMKTGRGFYDWSARDPKQLLERRDRQILHQLEFLKELGMV